jgi:hypothetical protein
VCDHKDIAKVGSDMEHEVLAGAISRKSLEVDCTLK